MKIAAVLALPAVATFAPWAYATHLSLLLAGLVIANIRGPELDELAKVLRALARRASQHSLKPVGIALDFMALVLLAASAGLGFIGTGLRQLSRAVDAISSGRPRADNTDDEDLPPVPREAMAAPLKHRDDDTDDRPPAA